MTMDIQALIGVTRAFETRSDVAIGVYCGSLELN